MSTAPARTVESARTAESAELPIAAEAWLTHLVVERGRSPRTIAAYRADLARWVLWLSDRGLHVDGAGPGDVQDYAAELRASGLAPSSVARMVGTVRNLYRFLVAEGDLSLDPAGDMEMPRLPDPVPRALPEADVLAVLDAVGEAAASGDPVALRDRALLELLYGTGARVSEACGLGFGGLDLDGALVRLHGKRDKERVVPLGRPARRAIAEYLDGGRPVLALASPGRDAADAVLLGIRGRRLSRQAAWVALRRWVLAAGVEGDISPHVLRHSCATHMLDHGADVRTVAELLGHVSVSTTQIYTRVATERLFEAWRAAHPRAQMSRGSG